MPARAPLVIHAHDDEVRRSGVTTMLREAGFEVVEADGGKRALELARTVAPEVVLCAGRMRDLDGLEVCRQIRANPATAAIAVVLYSTGLVADEHRAHGLDSGPDAYLTGPVTPEVLRATLQAVLRARLGEGAGERSLFGSVGHGEDRLRLALGAAGRRWRVLSDVARSIGASLDLDTVLQRVLRGAHELCRSDTGAIFLRDGRGPGVVPRYRVGEWLSSYTGLRIEPGRGAGGQVLVTGEPLRTDDYLNDPRIPEPYRGIAADAGTIALMVLPILIGGRVEGLLYLSNRTSRPFTDEDEAVCARLAEQAAVAIQNAELFAREQAARVQAETAEGHLRLVLDAARMGTWEWTIDTGAVRWSPGLETIHGLAPGNFPGTFAAFQKDIHPDDRDRVLCVLAEALEQRREHHVEYRIVRPDGAVRWVEGRGQVFRDAEGRPDRMVGVCADVTERKHAEEKFQLAVEAAPTAMIIVDRHGTIVLVNALAERLLGYARDEITGRSIEDLVPPRFRSRHTAHRTGFFADLRRRPMGAGRDLYALRKDGSEVPVEIGLSPFATTDGVFVLAAVTDITERRQIEEERARLLVREQAARREAEEANRAKDDFLAVLSHELRTPLTTILGWVRMLRTARLEPAQQQRALETVERNTQAQARMIDELLDLSRITAGKLTLDCRALSLAPLVAETVGSLEHEATAKGVTIEIHLDRGAGTVSADAHRVRQILVNLLANAIKFTPSGGRVDVHLAAAGDVVRIVVKDTGVGIERELLPHVFERFRQADWRTAGTEGGLGLGLAIVREIVERHGGTVEAHSDGPARGATFVVTLPVIRATPPS